MEILKNWLNYPLNGGRDANFFGEDVLVKQLDEYLCHFNI